MSGGHYNYMCYTIEDTYENELEFPVLNQMLVDFCKLLKSLEWYKSGDTSQEDYHEDAKKFMDKYFKTSKSQELKAISELEQKLNKSVKEWLAELTKD